MIRFPSHWEQVSLEEAIDFCLGGDWGSNSSSQTDNMVEVKVIRGTEFKNWKKEKGYGASRRFLKLSSLEKRRLQEGDIVVEVSGGGPTQPVGRTVLIDQETIKSSYPLVCSNFFRQIRLYNFLSSLFVHYYLTYAYKCGYFNPLQTQTTNLRNLNFNDFLKITIPLPPNKEQYILAKNIDNLFDKLNICQERIDKIPAILKHFRQAVLEAACAGRLTQGWREKNNVTSYGNFAIEEIPDGWRIANVGDIIESLKYGTAKKCSYEKNGVPVLRIPNIANGLIDHADLKYAKLSSKELDQLRLIPGDILIIRSNGSVSLVGKCAIIGEQERDFAYAGYLIRIRPNRSVVEPEFINLLLGSYNIRLQIELQARSTSGVNNINGDEIRALHFMLPPLAEQQEIVKRVKELFALADGIDKRYKIAQTCVQKLPQSILAKAFRGELVPQNPTDEPASVLLEQIRVEKHKQKPGNKPNAARRKKGT